MRSSPARGTCSRIPWLWVTIVLFGVVLMLQLAPQMVLMPKLVTAQSASGDRRLRALLTTLMGSGPSPARSSSGRSSHAGGAASISYWFWVLNSLAVVGIALSPWYRGRPAP